MAITIGAYHRNNCIYAFLKTMYCSRLIFNKEFNYLNIKQGVRGTKMPFSAALAETFGSVRITTAHAVS